MKTKYIINSGLAFAEKKDMKKLEKLASEGWLLKELSFGGFFYKLQQLPIFESLIVQKANWRKYH